MFVLEILALIVLIVCAILGGIMLMLLIGARLGLWGLMISISRDMEHEHDEEGNCIPPEPKSRRRDRTRTANWPDGSHERID